MKLSRLPFTTAVARVCEHNLADLYCGHSSSHAYPSPFFFGVTRWGLFPEWLLTIFASAVYPGAFTIAPSVSKSSVAFSAMRSSAWRGSPSFVVRGVTLLVVRRGTGACTWDDFCTSRNLVTGPDVSSKSWSSHFRTRVVREVLKSSSL